MTITEALKIVDVNGYGTTENVNTEAHDIINHEMKYRIQRAPREKEVTGTSVFAEAFCPVCGNLIFGTENYCSNCGQAIDWSEVTE